MAGTPRARLKRALVEVGKFARGLRRAAPMIFADLAYGNKEAFAFFGSNFTEHVRHLASLAAECRAGSALSGRSVPFMIVSLLPVMIFPVLMAGVLERNEVRSVGGRKLEEFAEEVFSDAGVEERAETALRGIGL